MKSILGIPVIENALLPQGTAFLVVQEKGVVKQMVQVYPTPIDNYSTASLISELEKRRPCGKCKCDKNTEPDCSYCIFNEDIKDNFCPLNRP